MAAAKQTGNVPVGLLVFKGLASLAQDELRGLGVRHGKARVIELRNHELVLVSVRPDDLDAVGRLRTVEDLFHVPLAEAPMRTRNDLKALARRWRPQHVQDGLAVKNAVFERGRGGKPTYWVFVKADRDRQIKRKDIAQTLAKAPASFSRWKAADPAAVEIWGFFANERLTAGVRLTDSTFRHRRGLDRERKGALRPTIAAAMVVASRPRPDDVVLDPMCGVGTLLFERVQAERAGAVHGFDIDPEAVAHAGPNLAKAAGAAVSVGDATDLALPDQSVDVILCNLPFGRAYSSHEANRELYPRLRNELRRVLRPGGRMVLLTNDMDNFTRAFSGRGFDCRKAARVQVLGVWASIMLCTPSGRDAKAVSH